MKTSIILLKRTISIAFFVVIILISTKSYSQFSRKYINLYENAVYLSYEEDYLNALPLWLKIDSLKPDIPNVHFYIGVCLMNNGEKINALPYLQEAAKATEIEYDGNYKEVFAPYQVYYFLGHAFEVNGDMDYAIENYEKFKVFAEEHDKKQLKKVIKKITDCQKAREFLVVSSVSN